jgi:hypothetical protein
LGEIPYDKLNLSEEVQEQVILWPNWFFLAYLQELLFHFIYAHHEMFRRMILAQDDDSN